MAYGRRRFKRGFKKRYGGRYKKRRSYGRFGGKYMRTKRSKLYRRAGNFAAPTGGKPEAKSIDGIPYNWIATDGGAGNYYQNAALYSLWNGTGSPGSLLTATCGVTNNTTSGNALVLLNALAQGNDIDQRVGRQVVNKSLSFKAEFNAGAIITPAGNAIQTVQSGSTAISSLRIMIVYDKQFNASMPIKNDILASVGSSGILGGGTNEVAVSSNMNLANRGRFLILCDKIYRLDAVFNKVVSVNIFKRLNLKTVYNEAPEETASGIQTGALLLCCVSDQNNGLSSAAVATPTATIFCPFAMFPNFRLRFWDP